jgi:hypothetical protein
MIKFRLEIQNPWSKNLFKDLGSISGKLSKNKGWEIQHTFCDGSILDGVIDWTRRCDHAGLEIGIGLIGYGINFRIYDTRHWNQDENRWKTYD